MLRRLRSGLASVYVVLLLAAAMSASAQTSGTNWNLIPAPSTGPGISTNGTAPPPSSEPDNLYLLNGAAGVAESPLPQSIKDDLIPPPAEPGGVSTLSEEEETVYIIGKEIVDGIVASEAAGALTPELEAIAEPLDEETSGSALAAKGLFSSCATHERTTTRTVSLNGKTWSDDFDLGSGFTGTYSLTGQLEGSVTAELKYGIKRRKVFGKCVPYGLEFRSLHAFGNAKSDGGVTLNGTLNYSDDFGPWDIAKPELFDVVFYVGPIPVRVILNMPIIAGLSVTANVAGQVNYNGTHVASGTFDYTCTLTTCTGSNNFDNTPENGNTQQITGNVEGRVKPTVWVDVGFRGVLYAEWFAYGQVGVRPHLLGDLWGYAGNQCGDEDGDGDFETVRALTFDLDRRIDLTRESKVLGRDPKKGTIRTGSVKHVGFYDLVNSTAMRPYLLGLGAHEVNDPGEYKVRMRPCWPYTDQVTYQLNWGDGSQVQELQGAPGTEVPASHAWTAAGSYPVTATSVRDQHGRGIDESISRTVVVSPPVPLALTVTPSPASATYGNAITWTATATGGHAASTQYSMGRRRVGSDDWIVTGWQTSNVYTWTPTAQDLGEWEIAVIVKDRNTPPDANNGNGYAVYVNPGKVQIVAPLTVTCTLSQTTVTHGNSVTWTATASGGTPGTIQYLLSRQLAGTSNWVNGTWQTGNVFTWTPAAADLGTWQSYITVKDANSPADPGYTTFCDGGKVTVVSPLTLGVTQSPATSIHGNAITWTATASGGTPASTQYALFRRRAGATDWIPSVSSPAWQASNSLSWTPSAADVGNWEIIIWVRDGNTPANANGYGYAAYAHAGNVQVVTPPLTLTVTGSPAQIVYGNAITWQATAGGGTPATTRYAFFRRRAGTTSWTPDVTAPAWQTSNVWSWTPASADVGTWEIYVWVKDGDTPATMNTYGYAAGFNPGPVKIVTPPITLTGTSSPANVTYGNALTWTATAGGGTPATMRYALFRRRAGATAWTPDVTAPAWQASNVLSWTPASADTGTWEIVVWAKDGDTPATMNTYGYAAYYNAGPVQVVAPLTLTVTNTPPSRPHDDARVLSWTATASGGVAGTYQYAFFRRRAGATAWIPSVTSPAWQTSNTFAWDPTAADVGAWDIYVWVKDSATPASMNTYGYAAGYNPGQLTVTGPLSLSSTASPAYVNPGTAINWTATHSGGYAPTTEFALVRRRAGTTTWTTPVWQASNVLSWNPASTDTGTWEVMLWVRDDDTPPSPGYGAAYNPGNVQVASAMTVSGTGSPQYATYGNTLTWTANASGGDAATLRYAFFRRRAGTTAWTPDVTAPAWQAGNVMSWTPTSADTGTWETIIWVKDGTTPASMNTYGYAAYYNAGPVEVIAPVSLTGTGSPSAVYSGTSISWTVTASGGVSSTRQYAFFRRRAGASAWTPSVTSPNWQTSRTFTWTPASTDAGTWEIIFWVKDSATPASMNTYGYAAYYNAGPVQVATPPTLSCTGSPSSAYYGQTITWTANIGGGTGTGIRYAFFRRRAGDANWSPSITSPNWQTSNSHSWTPSSSDVGTWETYVWVKDSATPSTMNTYGYAAGCNSGPVQIVAPAPLTVSGSGSPSTSPAGTSISWTANASGGVPGTIRYALFRRKAGTSNWIPDVTSPSWQTSSTLRWTPSSNDVGTWEIVIWVKDVNTSSTQNTYGFAAYYNAGPVQVY